MFDNLRRILEMIRFSHTVFALPFALLAAVMAWTAPAPAGSDVEIGFRGLHLLGILLCMVFARSAAMAFNRIVDRHIDAQNPRTAGRHLPAGQLTLTSVIFFTVATSGGFVLSTLLFLPNTLPILLSLPVLAFLLLYSFTKRFTSLAHVWLGAALMLAPVCAWIALRGELLWAHPSDILPAVVLGLSVLTWVTGFDIIYACQDQEFDRQSQLRSVPALLGTRGALRAAAVSHAVTLVCLVLLPVCFPQLGLGWIFWSGVAAVAVLLVYEHAMVRPEDLTRVNIAFFNVNAIISLGLFVVGALDLLT